jgi:phosphomannomutase
LLLADEIARRPGATGTLACSIVSCSGLEAIARANGLGFAETLTGFKWISKVDGLIFGFEEALGFCVDPAGVERAGGRVTHVNLNDGTLEGFVHADLGVICVQFHPEAAPGPNDSSHLVLDRFLRFAGAHASWGGGSPPATPPVPSKES